ncbi:hypothetical protein LEP1GSC052_0788 [Leptospira kmetyi serovar Malaysia str. Bejo-Iso9]|nr:hypothetical protein LEP1GSC052_0788 [Leptospira kmetyi serovar Malaysia str. Bejo-Iso9]
MKVNTNTRALFFMEVRISLSIMFANGIQKSVDMDRKAVLGPG